MKIKRIRIRSSQLEAVGYDAATKSLDVEFIGRGGRPNAVYRYANVSPSVFEEFMQADSKGKYINQAIAAFPNRFPYRKLNPDEQ